MEQDKAKVPKIDPAELAKIIAKKKKVIKSQEIIIKANEIRQ